MKYKEFKRQLGKSAVTLKEFASLLQMHPNSVTNYSQKGDVPYHLAVIASLMGEMAENKIDFKNVLSRIENE